MNIIKTDNRQQLYEQAATLIAAQIIAKPDSVIGFATGSTPEGIYQNLVERYKNNFLDFSAITSFNLDEYYGLAGSHPQSYRYYMQEKLFGQVNINAEKIHIPDGSRKDAGAACQDYEKQMAQAGGIDFQLLGIGRNGHIGFNEPAEFFPGDTHLVDLTEDTLQANQRFFASREEMPTQALSMGIKSIMKARKIVLVAFGEDKREAIEGMVNGPITPQLPASVLQLHPDVTIIYCPV